MTTRSRSLTALLLIIVPVLFNVFFFLLQSSFGYPDILREPADTILRQFAAGGTSLLAIWYGFALTPALFIRQPSCCAAPFRAIRRSSRWPLPSPS
jgi:hypothetical protein